MSRILSIEELIGWTDLLTEEEHLTRATVSRLVREKLMPRIASDYEEGKAPVELIGDLAELGLFGANIDGYGCAGMSNVAYGIACHELEAGDTGLRSLVSVQTSLCMYAINRFGSEEQKERWLPEMAAGRVLGCFGLTEPDHGSDPGGMETRARRDGDEWVISGNKAWITNAQHSQLAVVWAKAGPGPESIMGFLVECDQEGFSTSDVGHKMSLRASATGSLHLDEVRVPEANRFPAAEGLRAPLSCLNNARFGVAFGVLGGARFCLERAISYARERTQFGVPIARKQLIQAQLAEMTSEVVKASLLALHYGRLKDLGKLSPAQVSLFKRNNCRIALAVARQARSILGANGITLDYDVIRHAANFESTITYEGTDEMHSLIIGRAITGEAAF